MKPSKIKQEISRLSSKVIRIVFLVVSVFVRSRAVELRGKVRRSEFGDLIIQHKEFKVTCNS